MDSFRLKGCGYLVSSTVFLLCCVVCHTNQQATVDLMDSNMDNILQHNDIVFVNFYANWCRFSQMLKPIFEEAAKVAQQEFPGQGQVVFGGLDCDKYPALAKKYHISKYPTLKLFRGGQLAKREYRSQRSKDAFVSHIRDNLKDPLVKLTNPDEVPNLDESKRKVIGYFKSYEDAEYTAFRRVASSLRDDCSFFAGSGEAFSKELAPGNSIMYRPPRSIDQDMLFMGSMTNVELLRAWSTDKCIPLVREITFENGEELTEEGLPFLILFHKPEDTEVVRQYNDMILRELISERGNMNFLTADGTKFTHPLHHLGKTPKDLPVIAIDSFRHMYLFPNIADVPVPGKLKQFVLDLHSGKLHREFHHGPDPAIQKTVPGSPKTVIDTDQTDPPESQFVKLMPSENRYSFRDEL
ncbi:endoplasmic reticulum resident protein 44 [Strongylocentrotus purpuratus]|uniref:Thioredoxin domain-containing protein n=1 Tax=Strongylocentrotus purpuratus TaxID=7668 RepID=A0A7M7RGS2_STRPU|nr:endoplasmic reticulum resident protein 44 [Strongylocentrotus purpuratus]|eukprot:XP_791945.2 PREDICTED: endoplasmic reticulum resident protein 44 [Strongylocentrotus purpuratus]